MSLDWMPRDDSPKDHFIHGDDHWGTEAPSVIFEKRPLRDPSGEVVPDLYVGWVTLNNIRINIHLKLMLLRIMLYAVQALAVLRD